MGTKRNYCILNKMKVENCLGSELSIMGCPEALSAYPVF